MLTLSILVHFPSFCYFDFVTLTFDFLTVQVFSMAMRYFTGGTLS